MHFDLKSCVRGDKRAWDAFVDRYAGVIVAAVAKVMKKRSDGVGGGGGAARGSAEINDAVQDVFVRLLKDECRLLKTFDPKRASITTWLTLVSRSTTIDGLRRKRLTARSIDSVEVAASPTANSESGAASGALRHLAEQPALPTQLLDSLLSPRQRLILQMLFEQDMTVPDAARALGVDEQTIRSGKHKALTKLREHFGVEPGG